MVFLNLTPLHKTLLAAPIVLLSFLIMNGCGSGNQQATPKRPAEDPNSLKKIEKDFSGLPNLIRINSNLYSGGQPKTKDGFESLRNLGIKTIVSCDGAQPNIDAAKAKGLKYVHIPVGYDGIKMESRQKVRKLIEEIPGPYYFHCHHGKHRAPSLAVFALSTISESETDKAKRLKVLTLAGTSKDYSGLWRDVEQGLTAEDLKFDRGEFELPEIAEVGDLAFAMADIDRIWERLLQLRDNQWERLPKHPDVIPDHEALLLMEGFRELQRNSDKKEIFEKEFKETETNAAALREYLKSGKKKEADKIFSSIESDCKKCHEKHRGW